MSAQINDPAVVPLSATDVARLYRKAYGRPTMSAEDFEFADALMRERVLRLGAESLRDKLAAKVMPAAYADYREHVRTTGYCDENWRTGIALDAYAMADAMLAARAKGGAA